MGRMSIVLSLELRHGQCIDAIIFRVGADELHESDLPMEIEGGNQAIVSSGDLESHALAIRYLGSRSGFLNLIGRSPLRGSHDRVPAFKRDLCFRVLAPEADKHVSSNYPHAEPYHVPKTGTRVLTPCSGKRPRLRHSARSQAVADLPIGARGGLRHHRGIAK